MGDKEDSQFHTRTFRQIYVMVFILLILTASFSHAESALIWRRTAVTKATAVDQYRVILRGKSLPNAKIDIRLPDAIVLRPPAGAEKSSLKYPAPLESHLKSITVAVDPVTPAAKRFRTTIKDCNVLKEASESAEKLAAVRPGQRLWTEAHNGNWYTVYGKSSRGFISAMCMEKEFSTMTPAVTSKTLKAKPSGEFITAIQLPLGLFQIPIEVTSAKGTNTILTRIEVLENKVLINDKELTGERAGARKKSAGLVYYFWLGGGYDSQDYSEDTAGGNIKHKHNSLQSREVGATIQGERFGFSLSNLWSRGKIEDVPASLVTVEDSYVLSQIRGLGIYKLGAGRRWHILGGAEYRIGPHITLGGAGGNEIAIMDHALASVLLGIGTDWFIAGDWSSRADLILSKHVMQKVGSSSAATGSNFGLDGRIDLKYKYSSWGSMAAALSGDWLKNAPDGFTRTFLLLRTHFLVGFEF
jgi:hypothetical protein